MAKNKQQIAGSPHPEAARPAYEVVVGLIDTFCREHLRGVSGDLCREMAGILARKRPSPLPGASPRPGPAGSSARSAGSTSSTTEQAGRT